MSVRNRILKLSSDYGFLIYIVQIILGIEEEREEDWSWQLNLANGMRYIKEIELATHVDFYNLHSSVSFGTYNMGSEAERKSFSKR
ncbi:hypothetical protein SLEP1_g51873 [Rubroshorea leprosula]|uniref:Uncharacterized protein n=1 Tax=Rubroshorea leprosula TaxID=152421 RepID=A0AAV5M671_9ROSI|nr:hypothetical protein SLEP1_g51873 [Rubroshorea leprosula]